MIDSEMELMLKKNEEGYQLSPNKIVYLHKRIIVCQWK